MSQSLPVVHVSPEALLKMAREGRILVSIPVAGGEPAVHPIILVERPA